MTNAARAKLGVLITIGFIVLIVLFSSCYVVQEWEQVVITQFGDPVGEPIVEAGLHFKTPFTQTVNRFEKRILIWDGERNQVPTDDKRFIWVDTTARWKIRDPLVFLQAVRTVEGAQSRLDDYLDSAVRDVIGKHKLVEVVRLTNRVLDVVPFGDEPGRGPVDTEVHEKISTGRDELTAEMYQNAKSKVDDLGIDLIDLRIKRINYVESVRKSVYERMISERQRIAEQYRSEGRGKKAEVEGQRARDEKKILSEAYRDAQTIVARADAVAAQLFADAYNSDPEFYAFIRTLKVYEKIVGDNHTLVIDPASDLYRYLASVGLTKK
ncbi:MAG: protease modulator HflC [Planctomycetota bacterium]|nr:protease modulator HflC [Planctomycetota bacterium]